MSFRSDFRAFLRRVVVCQESKKSKMVKTRSAETLGHRESPVLVGGPGGPPRLHVLRFRSDFRLISLFKVKKVL